MDAGKAKALVDWVNTLAVGDCIEGISQLQDGKIFCNIINLCDHDFNADDLSSNEERFAKLITFLEGQYETRLQTKIDLQCALSGNQFELGKVCLLLMSCTVMCVNNDQIMERALKLDTIDQMHVRDMIEYVLLPNSQLTGLESTFYQILCRPIVPPVTSGELNRSVRCSTPRMINERRLSLLSGSPVFVSDGQIPDSRDGHISTLNSSSSTSSSTNVLHRFASPRGFIINSSTCMSPVQQMMQSPNMASKIREDQRIKRLRRDLEAEKKKRHGLEEAMLDKEEEMIKKESELEEVEVKLRQLQKHCNKINEHLNIVTQHQAEGKQHAADQEKINYLHKEMKELQDRNKILSTENCQMSSEYTAFKEQSEKLSVVRKQKADLSTRIIELEVNLSEVTDQLDERSSNLETLQANYNTVVTEIENEREWYKEVMNDVQAKKGNDSSVLMRSIGGDCMAGVIDLKLQELEMELANETAIRKTLKAELDSALNSIARSGERTQTLESQNGELTKSHNVLLQQIADLEQQKFTEETRLQQELQQLGNALSKVESMYEESERKWNEQISAVNAELDARQTRVNDLEAELRHRDGKIEHCEKVEVELRGELNAQRQQCDEYLAKLEVEHLELLQCTDRLTTLQNEQEATASKYDSMCREKMKVDEQMREMVLKHNEQLQSAQTVRDTIDAEHARVVESFEEKLTAGEVTRAEQREMYDAQVTALRNDIHEANMLHEGMVATCSAHKQKIQDLLDEVKGVNEAKVVVEGRCENYERSVKELEGKLQYSIDSEVTLKQACVQSEDRVNDLRAKVNKLEVSEKGFMRNCYDLKAAVDRMRGERDALEDCNDEIEQELKAVVDRMRGERDALEGRNNELEQELKVVHGNVTELEGKLKVASESEGQLRRTLKEHESGVNRLVNQLQKSQESEAIAKSDCCRAEESNTEMSETIRNLNVEKMELSERCGASEDEVDRISKEVARLTEEAGVLEQRCQGSAVKAEAVCEELNVAKAVTLELEDKLNSLKVQHQSELSKSRLEQEQLEVELRCLREKCSVMESSMESTSSSSQERLCEVMDELRRHQSTEVTLNSELSDVRAECERLSEQLAAKTEESENLSEKCEMSKREYEGLAGKLTEMQTQSEKLTAQLEQQESEYKHLSTQMEQKVSECSTMETQLSARVNTCVELEQLLSESRVELEGKKAELSEFEQVNTDYKDRLFMCETDLQVYRENGEQLTEQLERSEKQHENLMEEIAAMKQSAEQMSSRAEQSDGKFVKLTENIKLLAQHSQEKEQNLEQQVRAKQTECDAMSDGVAQTEQKVIHLEQLLAQVQRERDSTTSELENARQLIVTKDGHVSSLQQKVLKMKDELTGSDSAASKYEQQCMLWEQRNADLTAKFEANNLTKDQEYHRELSEREDELDNLQGELENTNSELTELRKELASARSELKLRAQKIEQQVVEQRELCSQYQEKLSAVEQQSMEEVKAVLTAKEKELEQIMSQQEQHANEQRCEQSHNAKHVETLLTSAQTDKMRLQQDMGQLERQYVNDRETYQANLTARATEIEHLRQTLAHEQQVAQTQLKEYESTMMAQISEQKQRVQDVSTHLAEHKDEIERLNSALRKQEIASHEAQQTHKQEVESLQTDLQNLFTENNALRCLEASSREKQVTIECLEKDKLELIEHGCKEQRALRQEYDSTVSNMKQQFTDLSTDKEQLANRLGELTEQHRVLIDETHEQRMTLTRYEEERKVLQQSKVQQAKSAAQLVKLQQEVEHMLSQQESGEAEIRQLRSSQSRRMSAAKLKHAQLQEQMTHQQTDVSDNDERLEALIASVSRLATYQEERKHKHSKELSDIRQKYKQQLDNVVSQWQQKYDKLVLNNNKCKDQSSTLAKQYDSMMEECEKRLTKKREELRGARSELQGERAGLLDMEAELRGARAELQGRNESVRQLDEQLQSLTQQLTEFRSKILALTSENESLSKEIELLKALGASQTSQTRKETTFACNLDVEDDVMMDTESAPMSLDELGSERDVSSDSRRGSGVSTRSMDSSRRGSGVSTRSLSVSHPHLHPQLSRLSISSPSLTNSMRRESSSNLHNRPRNSLSNSQRTTRLSSSAMSLPAQTQSKQNVTFKSPAFKSPTFKSPNPRRTSGRLSSSAHDTRSKMSRLSIGATASASFEPSRSATLPRSMLFEEEDESHIFDWDRMSELNRRNTLCLPHLKTSYPVETQTKALQEFNEKALQSGALKESTSIKPISTTATLLSFKQHHPGGGGHPQPPSDTLNNLMNPPVETKTPRTKRKYTAQLVKAFTKSHKSTPNKKNRSTPTRKSPRTPSTPPITPRRSGRTPQSKMNQENQDSKKKNPVSFNIGFTPTRSVKRLSNLVSRKRQASSTTTVLGGPPLGTSSLPGPTGPSGSAATPKMFKRPLTDFTNNTLFK